MIINEKGEILAFQLTPGNVADVSVAETLSKGIFGKLFKGYISADLAKRLLNQGLELFIETVNDQLKNIAQIEHTRHRSPGNFLVNLLSGIVAYTHRPKKPSINILEQDRMLLMAA